MNVCATLGSTAPTRPPDIRVEAAGLRALSRAELEAMGIDVDEGLRYCGGKPALYRRLLELYRTEHVLTFGDRWQAACRDGDARTAARLAHTFKGVCRSVGARSLGEQAAALESALESARIEGEPGRLDPLPGDLLSAIQVLCVGLGRPEEGSQPAEAAGLPPAHPMEPA